MGLRKCLRRKGVIFLSFARKGLEYCSKEFGILFCVDFAFIIRRNIEWIFCPSSMELFIYFFSYLIHSQDLPFLFFILKVLKICNISSMARNERRKEGELSFIKCRQVMEDDLLVIKNMQLIFDSMRIFKLTRMAECKLSVVNMKYMMQLRGSIVRFLKHARHGEVNFGFIAQSQLHNGSV